MSNQPQISFAHCFTLSNTDLSCCGCVSQLLFLAIKSAISCLEYHSAFAFCANSYSLLDSSPSDWGDTLPAITCIHSGIGSCHGCSGATVLVCTGSSVLLLVCCTGVFITLGTTGALIQAPLVIHLVIAVLTAF